MCYVRVATTKRERDAKGGREPYKSLRVRLGDEGPGTRITERGEREGEEGRVLRNEESDREDKDALGV